MSADNIWFPLYIGDYLADTMHLSCLQHGAYDLLLFAYYRRRGPLPDNDEILARITKLTVTDWQAIRSPLSEFFKIKDSLWFHKRADSEIKRRDFTKAARQQAATQTNLKLGRTVTDTVTVSPTDTVSERSTVRKTDGLSQSQSQSYKEKKGQSRFNPPSVEEVKLAAAKSGLSEPEAIKFHAYYESNGWRVGKNPMKNWTSALTGWKTRSAQYQPNGHPEPSIDFSKVKLEQW